MAAYISVPRDLTKVRTKVAFNLTKRQLICFSIGAAIGVPSFFAVKHFAGATAGTATMIIVMLPLFFIAMYERNGQFIETILRHYAEFAFIRPKVRPYRTDNYYTAVMRQKQAEREVERIVRISEEAFEKKKRKRSGDRSAEASVKGRAEGNQGDHQKGKKE